jgi:hypothetical protein
MSEVFQSEFGYWILFVIWNLGFGILGTQCEFIYLAMRSYAA